MTRDRDFIDVLEDYLGEYEGPTPLPDAVRDAIRAELPTTQQIGRLRGWMRLPNIFHVPMAAQFGLTAAVLLAAAVTGAALFGRAQEVGGPGLGDPSPTVSTIPAPLPGDRRTMEGGTYVTGDPFSVRLTFTLPAGWQGWVAGPFRVVVAPNDKPGAVSFMLFQEVSADPCRPEQGYLEPPPGPSVDDLVAALAGIPGIEVTDVADVTVDGYSGKQLTMAAPDSSDGCTPSTAGYVIWRLPLGYTHAMTPGARHRVWILDVVGERLVIVIPEETGYTDGQRTEIQEIFDSIRIEPAN